MYSLAEDHQYRWDFDWSVPRRHSAPNCISRRTEREFNDGCTFERSGSAQATMEARQFLGRCRDSRILCGKRDGLLSPTSRVERPCYLDRGGRGDSGDQSLHGRIIEVSGFKVRKEWWPVIRVSHLRRCLRTLPPSKWDPFPF